MWFGDLGYWCPELRNRKTRKNKKRVPRKPKTQRLPESARNLRSFDVPL
jgi:hypothetical protein